MTLLSDKLQKYNQEHVLSFYNEISEEQQKCLINEIKRIDMEQMHDLYKNSYFDEQIDINKISELFCITDLDEAEKKEYKAIGEDLIKQEQYSIVIMAGGNASRMGLDIPKGCVEIHLESRKFSLFELFINQLKDIYKKYKVYINLYIMTSKTNDESIKKFFEKNNYFDYPKESIRFFVQDELPILDIKGNLILEQKSHILFGPNGNGNVFKALKNSKLLKELQDNNIKYILFSTIDNVLTKLIDLEFIGATISNKYQLASKAITKKNANEKDWIFCKYENKPFMLPTNYITETITGTKNSNGEYIYREKNVTHHLIHIDLVTKFADLDLKYHRAYKKYKYIDESGQEIIPDSSNTFKFEQFIFDAFYFADDMLLYRINEDEFCPLKTKEDIKKVEEVLAKKMSCILHK